MVKPLGSMNCLIDGLAMILASSVSNRATMAGGVALATEMPDHDTASNPKYPASDMVGTFGSKRLRSRLSTAQRLLVGLAFHFGAAAPDLAASPDEA